MQAAEYLDSGDGRLTKAPSTHDEALVNLLLSGTTRSILLSTMERAKSVENISRATGIPKSTCYEKVGELLDSGVVRRERILVTKTGMRFALYRATVKAFQLRIGISGSEVAVVVNDDEFHHSPVPRVFALEQGDAIPYSKPVVRRALRR